MTAYRTTIAKIKILIEAIETRYGFAPVILAGIFALGGLAIIGLIIFLIFIFFLVIAA